MRASHERLRANPDLDELAYAAKDEFAGIDFTLPQVKVAKAFRRGRAALLEVGGWDDDKHPDRAAAERVIKREFKHRRDLFARQLELLAPVFAREQRLLDEVERLEIRREAEAEVARRQQGERPSLTSLLLSIDDLGERPAVEWRIDRVMPVGLVFLVGESGIGKSAFALSMTLAIASGRPWLGRDAKPGSVLYIAGEGGAGLPQRVRAERAAWGGDNPDIEFMLVQLDLSDEGAVEQLEALNRERDYAVIVYDTLNRHAADAEENSATAMGRIIRNVDRIAAAGTSTSSLVLHHHGKNGTIRGSSALYAGADAVLTLDGEPGYLTLTATKMKDAEGGRLGDYKLATSPEHGSIHVEGLAPGQGAPSGAKAGRVEEALAHFVRAFGETGATRPQVKEHLMEVMSVQKSAADNYIGDLIRGGRLHVENRARGSFVTLAQSLTSFAITTDKEQPNE